MGTAGQGTRGEAWIPGLDGLRAASIAIVIGAHASVAAGVTRLTGVSGVCLFFLISGYLITTLLVEEQRRAGRISLGLFYARRALRILPPSYVMMATLVLLRHRGLLDFSDRGLLASVTYWRNYFRGDRPGDWVLDHTWSLSVEEQFYLLWPLAIAFLGPRRSLWAALLFALGWPAIRFVRHGALVQAGGAGALDIAGMDTILWGCAFALLVDRPGPRTRIGQLASWRFTPVVLAALIAGLYLEAGSLPPRDSALLPLARNLLLCGVLAVALRPALATSELRALGPLDRLLAWRPIVFIGRLSYSLYLWQQLFLRTDCQWRACSFPLNLACASALAALSWFGLERPLATLRHYLAAPARPAGPVERPARQLTIAQ